VLRRQLAGHQEKENCVELHLTVQFMDLAAVSSQLLLMGQQTIEMYAGIQEELHIPLSNVMIRAL
jgi:hypothetical protein